MYSLQTSRQFKVPPTDLKADPGTPHPNKRRIQQKKPRRLRSQRMCEDVAAQEQLRPAHSHDHCAATLSHPAFNRLDFNLEDSSPCPCGPRSTWQPPPRAADQQSCDVLTTAQGNLRESKRPAVKPNGTPDLLRRATGFCCFLKPPPPRPALSD